MSEPRGLTALMMMSPNESDAYGDHDEGENDNNDNVSQHVMMHPSSSSFHRDDGDDDELQEENVPLHALYMPESRSFLEGGGVVDLERVAMNVSSSGRRSELPRRGWYAHVGNASFSPKYIVALLSALVVILACALVAQHQQQQKCSFTAQEEKPRKKQTRPVVLLISTDGFRWDYYRRAPQGGALRRLLRDGTSAEFMKPVFPSKTFPNHYSIVTGLYPSWHGVVANSFYEPNLDEHFTMRNKNPDMWLGEPLWQSAVREGMNAATFFWPGAEVQKNRWTCPRKYCPRYDGSVPYSERVDAVLRWLDEPVDTRPQFLTLYFEEPDHTGHEKGPDSADVAEALAKVDAA